MWAVLSHPGFADYFDDLGPGYEPMRRLVAALARRPYAGQVFGVTSMAYLAITTAAAYREADGHDNVSIAFNPDTGLFDVGYNEWVSATRNPPCRTAARRSCEGSDVLDVLDRYVLRLLTLYRYRDEPA